MRLRGEWVIVCSSGSIADDLFCARATNKASYIFATLQIISLAEPLPLCNMVGMTLKEYLAASNRTASEVAKALGVSVSTITRAARGETIPAASIMLALADYTKGKVKPHDFFSKAA
jgi:DNA-binding XRE family transcriptional regulator